MRREQCPIFSVSDVTQIPTAVRAGDDAAAERLFERVYAELARSPASTMGQSCPK